MQLCLIPLTGPFQLRHPAYNAVTVRDTIKAFAPDALALTDLAADAFDTPSWQDTPEIALALSVIPWAKRKGLPSYGVLEPSPDTTALETFRRYAKEYPAVGERFRQVESKLRPVADKVEETLSLARILEELLPLIQDYQQFREAQLEDGPATDWLHARLKKMAERILALPHERVAVLASLDHYPFLLDSLKDKADILPPPSVEASEESRERSLFDFAFRTDVPEPANLIAKLRDVNKPEARYHEANLLLANGHLAEALELLEKASQGNFSEPYFLPGYLLARLGQLYDLAGQRDAALRSYRGVRALSYAPLDALEVAEQGLDKPFKG